jgi:hypothetical protein
MKTTIEQAAINYAAEYPCGIPNYNEDDYNAGCLNGAVNGFADGAKWAQQWISEEDELPPKGIEVLIKYKYDGSCFVGKYVGNGKMVNVYGNRILLPKFWRPIEIK